LISIGDRFSGGGTRECGPSRFRQALLREQGAALGELDARLSAAEGDANAAEPWFDPSYVAFSKSIYGAFMEYMTHTLGFHSELNYNINAEWMGPLNWSFAHKSPTGSHDALADTSNPLERASHNAQQGAGHQQPPYAIECARHFESTESLFHAEGEIGQPVLDCINFGGEFLIDAVDFVIEPPNVRLHVGYVGANVFDVGFQDSNTFFHWALRWVFEGGHRHGMDVDREEDRLMYIVPLTPVCKCLIYPRKLP